MRQTLLALTACVSLLASAQAQLVSQGLIARWRLDEVGTTYAHDSVGRNHGTRLGGIGDQAGISGRATSFQGASYGITPR
ncbi:MAG: hypothetical protein IPM13_19765 [Phycisphaerales bacterium]|nr:hypothetical protein [Phycisphaerales bacterium]